MRRMGDTAGRIKMLFTYQPPSLTGMYDKPTLSVHPRSEVTLGENVTFYCRLETATSMFFLLKEGRSSRPKHKYGNIQAEFSLSPVTTAHRGTYRCFGSYNNHVWSCPSDPVTLLITGEKTPNFPHVLSGTPSELQQWWGKVGRDREGISHQCPHPHPFPRGPVDCSWGRILEG